MIKPYFELIPDIGPLYLDLVFNTFEDENILFTCKDDNNNEYICVLYELRNGLKWIITKTNQTTDINNLINKKITIREAFFNPTKFIRIIYKYDITLIDYPIYDKIKDLLPSEGVYLKLDNHDFMESLYYSGISNKY